MDKWATIPDKPTPPPAALIRNVRHAVGQGQYKQHHA